MNSICQTEKKTHKYKEEIQNSFMEKLICNLKEKWTRAINSVKLNKSTYKNKVAVN